MKRLKTYKSFNEGKDYNLEVIKDMLLDFTDKDIEVHVSVDNIGTKMVSGSWVLLEKPIECIKVGIGKFNGPLFSPERCLLDVIDYLEESGFVMMDSSWMWNDSWQHYEGCPNCLSDNFEEDSSGTTIYRSRCNKCGYIGPSDSFLLDQWSVTRYDLAKDIAGRQVEQIELIFSDRVSLY
jgi:predicted Zn-ribbon and HTH transcriptional regulator